MERADNNARVDTSGRIWTIQDALDWTRGYLERKGDDRPRFSAEYLLAAATHKKNRIDVYVDFERPLTQTERECFREMVARRAIGEPLQYIVGTAPFRHLELEVGPGVLIPRPETEILVDEVIAFSRERRPHDESGPFLVADICTGSAAVALSIALELPDASVHATDISPEALEWATRNVDLAKDGVRSRVRLYEGDLTAPIPGSLHGSFDVVVSNPPYVPASDMDALPHEVKEFEPLCALDGGVDGLEVFSRLVEEAADLLAPGGLFLCELDENHVAQAACKRVEWYQDVRVVQDLTGRDRIYSARRL